MDRSNIMAAAVDRHAETIMKAAGSSLRNYDVNGSHKRILGAVFDCYEEAYRSGADYASDHYRAAARPDPQSDLIEALEKCRDLVRLHNHRQNEKLEDIPLIVDRALARIKGAKEGVK